MTEQQITLCQHIPKLVECEVAKVTGLPLNAIVADRTLSLGSAIQDEHSATKVGCGSVGKHLVVEIGIKPDASQVKKDVGNLVCENCSDGMSLKPVLLVKIDKEITRVRQLDTTRHS